MQYLRTTIYQNCYLHSRFILNESNYHTISSVSHKFQRNHNWKIIGSVNKENDRENKLNDNEWEYLKVEIYKIRAKIYHIYKCVTTNNDTK